MTAQICIYMLLAYLCGSVMGGPMLGRLRGGVNLRETGSGNVGATNALRSQGLAFGLAVLLIDFGKGLVAVALVPKLNIPLLSSGETSVWLPFLCAVAAILGHILPLFSGFRGGKGAATLAAVTLLVAPTVFPILAVVYGLVLTSTGYAGLSMVVAAASFPVVVFGLGLEPAWPMAAFAMFAAAIMGLTHRENFRRMRLNKEPRFERVMIWQRLRR